MKIDDLFSVEGRVALVTGGSRGIGELERRCSIDAKVAFALFPTSIDDLMSIADEGESMPPNISRRVLLPLPLGPTTDTKSLLPM